MSDLRKLPAMLRPARAFPTREAAERAGPPQAAATDPQAVLRAWDDVAARFSCVPGAPRAVVERSVQYVWQFTRSAILVAVREGRVRLFLPFVNPDFVNDWHAQLRDAPTLAPPHLPPRRWWCNAGILCTMHGMAPWTDSMNECYRHMVEAMVRVHGVRTWDGLLNRRDHPMVRRASPARRHPYAHVWARDPPVLPEPFDRCPLLPVLSPYVHPEHFEDTPVPCNLDWEAMLGHGVYFAATAVALCAAPPAPVPWDQRLPVAFFRGPPRPRSGCGWPRGSGTTPASTCGCGTGATAGSASTRARWNRRPRRPGRVSCPRPNGAATASC